MSKRYRINPLVSFAWQPADNGAALVFMAHDPLSNLSCCLNREDFWLLETLSANEDRVWTREEFVEAARARCPLGPAQADETLARLWSIILIDQARLAPDFYQAAGMWEHYGWKLALEYYASSTCDLQQPAQRRNPLAADPAVREALAESDVRLPEPEPLPPAPLNTVLHSRRTCRQFNAHPLDLQTVSFILAHAFRGRQEAPAHLLCHVFALRVNQLPVGIYRYAAGSHALQSVRLADRDVLEQEMVDILIGQSYIAGSAVSLLLSGNLDRLIAERQQPSALRAWLTGVGALAQRLILIGQARKVQSFLSAAILEDGARQSTLGEIGGAIVPIHQVAFGYAG